MRFWKEKLKDKYAVLVVSVCTIVLGGLIMIWNTIYQQRKTNQNAIESFENTASAMKTVVSNYLSGEQETCNVWARNLQRLPRTEMEAVELLDDVTVVVDISAQLVDPISFQGYSIRTKNGHYIPVDYNDDQYADLREEMLSVITDPHEVNVTRAYKNPVNGESVVAFIQTTEIVDDNGESRPMLVMRIVPMTTFKSVWVFPTYYKESEIELLDSNGYYISDSSLEGFDNFYDYIQCYNNMTDEAIATMRERVNSGVVTSDVYMLADGTQAFFVSSEVNSVAEEWAMIAYIPYSVLTDQNVNFVPLLTLFVVFIILYITNMGYYNEINEQLKKSIAETKHANEAKTEFLATMSHDIRTPMNAIIGMTAIAEKNIDDTHHVEECLRKINLSGNHLLTLVNDILDISKIESGHYAVNPVVLSLSDLMDNIMNIMRQNVKVKSLQLEVHTHNIEQEYIYADQLRLNQIYINILSNAVKYTNPSGRVTVDLYQKPSTVLANGVQLIYRVEDTGIGMSPEFMKRMYDAFARESDGRVDAVQGTGLGLAITKQLVDIMHGSIDVQSEQGKGSVFTVTLDLPVADSIVPDIILPNITMILIDDDQVFLESATDTMKQIGIDADVADSGRKGLEMIRDRHQRTADYQVVILDWKMPDMDGVAVTRAIRAEIGADVPIIIVSAYDYTEIEDEALAVGANGFISKPLFKSSVCRTLNDFFGSGRKEAPTQEHYSLEGMRILVAEDNDVNYEIAEYLLEDEGAQCSRAENGKICVEMLEQGEGCAYDLVLMDIQMPVLKGIDATKLIRNSQKECIRNIPIIAMTADAFAENIEECRNAGMDGHIAKPIDMTIVLNEIEHVMQRTQANRGDV